MSVNDTGAFRATQCTNTTTGEGTRILLVGAMGGLITYSDVLERAGFAVEFASDGARAIEICRRRAVRAIVLVETDSAPPPYTTDLVHRLNQVSPGVPCVLLPASASPTDSEIAIRTAIRWSSQAYLARGRGARAH